MTPKNGHFAIESGFITIKTYTATIAGIVILLVGLFGNVLPFWLHMYDRALHETAEKREARIAQVNANTNALSNVIETLQQVRADIAENRAIKLDLELLKINLRSTDEQIKELKRILSKQRG